jgi:tetratricopeptide (TPR) repeat protein
MIPARQSLQNVQFRMVRHYLDKLKQAETASRRGRENRTHWHNRIRQDWEQIKQWQAWSVGEKDTDLKRARLCVAFSLITPDILRVQLTPGEQLRWAQQALDAARRLGDGETERIVLYQAAFISLTIESLDQAEAYGHQLMAQAQAVQDALSMGRGWYILGTASFTRGVYDRAEECYTESLKQFEACAAAEEIPIVWRGLGRVSQFRGDYQQARTYHQQYLNASTATDNEQGILDAHVSLSGVFLALRDYLAAEYHGQRAVIMARPLGKWQLLPPALFSLAHAQKWLGKYETACNHYQEGISVARDIATAPSNLANGLYGLGQAKYLQGDYGTALAHFEEALAIAQSAQLVFRICQISHDMVFTHVALDEIEAACIRLKDALGSAQQLGTPQFMAKALASAIGLWQHLGQPEQVALWAGLLSRHTQMLHPSLFNPAVYERLEAELGAERYHDAMERGKALALESALSEILALLNSTTSLQGSGAYSDHLL